MGLIWLGTVPLTNGLVSQIFGVRYITTLFGIVFFGHQLGAFLGVWLGGYVFDLTESYDLLWFGSIASGLLAAALHMPINDANVVREEPLVQPHETLGHGEALRVAPPHRRDGHRDHRPQLTAYLEPTVSCPCSACSLSANDAFDAFENAAGNRDARAFTPTAPHLDRRSGNVGPRPNLWDSGACRLGRGPTTAFLTGHTRTGKFRVIVWTSIPAELSGSRGPTYARPAAKWLPLASPVGWAS